VSIIKWGIDFYTGLPEIDLQHQKLVALANQLSEVPADQHDDLERAFHELNDYIHEHFALEERMMDEAHVAVAHFEYHKIAHELFKARITDLWNAREDDSVTTLEQLLAFLTTWIFQHILYTDKKMALELHTKLGTEAPHNMFTHF
jgi:hemerythrin-like metal-binding protein